MFHTRCLVLLPVGPATHLNYLQDTLDSVLFYIGNKPSECLICLIDDTRSDILKSINWHNYPNIILKKAIDYSGEKNNSHPVNGPLFGKIVSALSSLSSEINSDIILKIDTDSLIIGDKPHLDAIEFIKHNQNIAIIGAYQFRGDGTFKKEAMAKKGKELEENARFFPQRLTGKQNPYYVT